MRPALITVSLATILLAACSKSENAASYEEAPAAERIDVRQEAIAPPGAASREGRGYDAPNIPVTAAPGVAFNYRYAFVLPDKGISAVQEQHATACEKLGPARCRITGMRYTLIDEDRVRGELHFKLDPMLARNFGKEGIAAVEKADGRLVDAAIEGTDVGGAITESQKRSQQLDQDLKRIEQRLAGSGLSDSERAELTRQADRMRQQQARERETRDQGEEMLANTPMTFTYSGDEGFTLGGNAFGDAWVAAKESFATMASIILLLIGTLLPWAVLVGLFLLVWRSPPLRNLRMRRKAKAEVVPANAPDTPASG